MNPTAARIPPAPPAPCRHAGIALAVRHIHAHAAEPLTLTALAAVAGLSVWRFATVFRQQMGMSPYRYINRLRVQHAQALLSSGMAAARVANEAGFYDQSHLSRHFKSLCGMTPGQYRSRLGHTLAS